MKVRHIVMVIALIVAAWLALFGNKAPSTGIAEPVVRATAATPSRTTSASAEKDQRNTVILPLKNREQLIGSDHDGNKPQALFSSHSWAPPPPPPPVSLAPPPPPSAPPLPFKYIGKQITDSGWEAFITLSKQIFIVHEKTVVQGTYRIDSIKPPILTVTYLPLQQTQTLNIGGID
jgi:hypothetical protein